MHRKIDVVRHHFKVPKCSSLDLNFWGVPSFRWLNYVLLSVPLSRTILCFPVSAGRCLSTLERSWWSSTEGYTLTRDKYLTQPHIKKPKLSSKSRFSWMISTSFKANSLTLADADVCSPLRSNCWKWMIFLNNNLSHSNISLNTHAKSFKKPYLVWWHQTG